MLEAQSGPMPIESEQSRNAIRLDGPCALISVVPHLVGFTPTNSLVLVVMSGPKSRVVLTIRADLPAREHPGQVKEFFEPLSRAIRTSNGEQLVAICYQSSTAPDPSEVLSGLLEAVCGNSIELVDFLVVDNNHWQSLLDESDAHSHPIADLLSEPTPAQAALVLEGRAPLASREALVDSFAPLPLNDPRVLVDLDLARAAEISVGHAIESLTASQPITKSDMAELVVALQSNKFRDRLISEALQSAQRADSGSASHLRGICEKLRLVVQAAPAGAVAPVATALAALAWQAGEGAIATCAIERALSGDPDYRLAILVQAALLTAMPPWFGREALIGTP